jgi:hypothetical protein
MNKYSDVVYGSNQKSAHSLIGLNCYGTYGSDMLSDPTSKGNTVYVWNYIWPDSGFYRIAGYKNAPKRVYYADTGKNISFKFDKENYCIVLENLPKKSPDEILGITVIAMEFNDEPEFRFCINYPHINDGYIEN